jgi:serine/threonine protein phosphatase PrpC
MLMAGGGFLSVVRTHVGCRRRHNEDAVLASPERRLWAVADGMGGHEAGEVASAMVVEALAICPEGAEAAIAALTDVNARLIEMARTGGEKRTIGSTVVGITANSSRFTCFWAGDSRAYRLGDGTLTRLTRDHSLVQELVDGGMIGEDEAETHPDSNIITRAVGVSEDLQVDTVSGDVSIGDLFLLASDGLTRLVSDEELSAELQHSDVESVADSLLRLALDREAPDNVSLILLRATGQPPPAARTILKHGLQSQ